jgi:hypothetical protein
METLETAFIPLLGSADAAQKRIADLSKFAAETPFELPEVAKASRTLETLTQGALATSEGLRLVGDVAFESVRTVAGWISPVPGGVGPMTIAMLLANTVRAARLTLAR